MARDKRNFYEAGLYHVIQRGNNKTYIFNDHLDKTYLLELLEDIKAKYPFYLLAYVLMDNHYHFLIEMIDFPVNKIMHGLNLSYSKYFNKKYGRVGTIFSERYKSISVESDKQFILLLQYIAYNPVKAGMVNSPEHYKWSSHYQMQQKAPSLVSKTRLLERLSQNTKLAEEKYKDIMQNDKKVTLLEWDMQKMKMKMSSIEYFYIHWSSSNDVRKRIKEKVREKEIFKERRIFVKEAIQNKYDVSEIAEFLNYSKRGIRRILSSCKED